MSTPYCYLIGWSKHNLWYYGCRYAFDANPNELWDTYFTSSKYVLQVRTSHGEPDIISVRRTFTTGTNTDNIKKCQYWEERVLRCLNAVYDSKWINKGNSGKHFNHSQMIPAKNRKTGELIGSISLLDPRVLSGELVHHSFGVPSKRKECHYCKKQFSIGNLSQHQNRCSKINTV